MCDFSRISDASLYFHLQAYGGYICDSTSIRRPFDCLSKVIKVKWRT